MDEFTEKELDMWNLIFRAAYQILKYDSSVFDEVTEARKSIPIIQDVEYIPPTR